jgi:hypothetical protein
MFYDLMDAASNPGLKWWLREDIDDLCNKDIGDHFEPQLPETEEVRSVVDYLERLVETRPELFQDASSKNILPMLSPPVPVVAPQQHPEKDVTELVKAGVATQLIAWGADVNAQDFWGRTPLRLAVETGYEIWK